jgi:hypothetical protein
VLQHEPVQLDAVGADFRIWDHGDNHI